MPSSAAIAVAVPSAVAGQHHDCVRCPAARSRSTASRAAFARPIGDGDDADQLAVARDEHRRPAAGAELRRVRRGCAGEHSPRSSNRRWLPSSTRRRRRALRRRVPAAPDVALGGSAAMPAARVVAGSPARSDAPSAARRRPRGRRCTVAVERRSSATHVDDFRACPRVSVPVLSNATQRTRLARSRCSAALDQHALARRAGQRRTIDTGVEITSAHGHETTSSTSAR